MSLSPEWFKAFETGFNNRYFLVRHGQSEANVAELVSSIYSVSVANHGLTETGIDQAITKAVPNFITAAKEISPDEDILGSKIVPCANGEITFNSTSLDNVVFYCSDFKRAYETGHYMKEALIQHVQDKKPANKVIAKAKLIHSPIPFYTSSALRERFFGVYEGAQPAGDCYDKTWALDKTLDVDSTHFGVESIQSVVTRTTELILQLEKIWSNKIIILVSHGDVTQIILSIFAAIDPRFHRTLPHMDNCDCRELLLVKGTF